MEDQEQGGGRLRGGSNRTRRGFQLDPTTPNGADITREEPGRKELEAGVRC